MALSERTILHCDLNNFYASVECLYNPSIRGKPVAVCGDAEARHGIVLAKNYIAKEYGIKTGHVIWEAKKLCPGLVVMPANFNLYLRFSKLARDIFNDYTDRVESFGVDECWLDITGRDGKKTADEIRERIRFEMGVTASVGVSWNKIFAKLGSDMKKPDATTIISKVNYKDTVFKLPAEELLYVGRATKRKLNKYNIWTIGDLATAPLDFLTARLGKWGEYLWTFANGYDAAPVACSDENTLIKSVGNSSTAIRDLKNDDDIRMLITVLSESVAARLREQWLKGCVVSVYLRDNKLESWGKQVKIKEPTFISEDIIETAMGLYKGFYDFKNPVRSVGVKVSDLVSADSPKQQDMFVSAEQAAKRQNMEIAIEEIRRRFGHFSINRAVEYLDKELTGFNPKDDHKIHPYSYF